MKLIITDDTGKSVEQDLGAGTYKVGRGETCQILLDDEAVSREHCAIDVLADKCILRDSGSMNGTLLNDKRVDEAELKDGDVIALGRTTMKVSLAAPQEEEAEAPPAEEEGGEKPPASEEAGEEPSP